MINNEHRAMLPNPKRKRRKKTIDERSTWKQGRDRKTGRRQRGMTTDKKPSRTWQKAGRVNICQERQIFFGNIDWQTGWT